VEEMRTPKKTGDVERNRVSSPFWRRSLMYFVRFLEDAAATGAATHVAADIAFIFFAISSRRKSQ
jgi:hypothetical protein